MIDPGNGIHPNIPFDDYLSIRRLNNTDLRYMGQSPAHFLHNQTEKRKDTKALRRGRAVSLALFEPEMYRTSYAVFEDRKAGKEWDRFKAAMGPDVEILKPDESDEIKAIVAAVRSSEMARPYVTGGKGEVSICWTHKQADLPNNPGFSIDCKGRLDFVPNWCALSDVKTTRNADPEAFSKQAFQLGYHVAASWYVDAWKNLTGEERPFFLVAVEATPPHVVQVFKVTDEELAKGRATYLARLDRLALCRKESRYPGYAEAVMDLPIPPWEQEQDDVEGEISEEAA